MCQRHVAGFILDVDEHGVALIERATLAVLPSQAHGSSLHQQRAKRDGLGHAVVKSPLTSSHFGALLQQLLDLGVDVKGGWIRREAVADLPYLRSVQSGLGIEVILEAAAGVG